MLLVVGPTRHSPSNAKPSRLFLPRQLCCGWLLSPPHFPHRHRRHPKCRSAAAFRRSDDSVDIWEFALQPGASCDFHKHTLPYIFVNLATSTTQALAADGSLVGEPNLQLAGHCVFVGPDALGAHGVRNVGEEAFIQLVVELKRCADGGKPAAPVTIAEAEERVADTRARLNAATAETAEAQALIVELQAAQEALTEMQCEEQRRECERSLRGTSGGGEAAALALDALVASGIPPDAGCARSIGRVRE